MLGRNQVPTSPIYAWKSHQNTHHSKTSNTGNTATNILTSSPCVHEAWAPPNISATQKKAKRKFWILAITLLRYVLSSLAKEWRPGSRIGEMEVRRANRGQERWGTRAHAIVGNLIQTSRDNRTKLSAIYCLIASWRTNITIYLGTADGLGQYIE